MSEVLNAEVTGNEKREFSRRRVVKGVAWSVPVIVTAIAAPAAAASPGTYVTLFNFANLEAATFAQLANNNSGQNRPGKGPVSFHVKNTSGAPSGAISGRITISSADTVDPGVGIRAETFTQGSLTPTAAPPASPYSANFTLSGGVANTATATFPLGFYYTGTSKKAAPDKQFNLTVTFTSPAGLPSLSTTLVLGAG